MPDLLVNLLKLPAPEDTSTRSFNIRRAQPFELTPIRNFVSENFSRSWADELSVGFARQPISVFVATIDRELAGFAAYECTRRGFFGPTGVIPAARGRGIGKALLLASLEAEAFREINFDVRTSDKPHPANRSRRKNVSRSCKRSAFLVGMKLPRVLPGILSIPYARRTSSIRSASRCKSRR